MTSTVPLACCRASRSRAEMWRTPSLMVHEMADVSPDSCEVTLMEYSLLGTMTRCTGALTLTELKTAVLTFLALALIAMTAARAMVMNFFIIVMFLFVINYCFIVFEKMSFVF